MRHQYHPGADGAVRVHDGLPETARSLLKTGPRCQGAGHVFPDRRLDNVMQHSRSSQYEERVLQDIVQPAQEGVTSL